MAASNAPDGTGNAGPGGQGPEGRLDDLERRRRALEASLATRRPGADEGKGAGHGSASGYGQALKLSSEFIAGVAVGAGLGWVIDRLAGTSPWGLIVFLLLGFAAGVLNVLRSAGQISEAGSRAPGRGPGKPGQN